MKATELRIGNWISSKLHNGLHTEIFTVFHGSVKLGCNPIALYKEDEIEPIPLTEEWLLKFGFEKANDNEHYFIKHYGYCLIFDGQDWCLKQVINEPYVICYLRNVHQIQNLYHAFTGEELTLKQ